MGKVIEFGAFFEERPPEELGRQELLARLDEVREELARLDEEEPENMYSPEYEQWGDCREELEDLADEIMDLLDDLSDA